MSTTAPASKAATPLNGEFPDNQDINWEILKWLPIQDISAMQETSKKHCTLAQGFLDTNGGRLCQKDFDRFLAGRIIAKPIKELTFADYKTLFAFRLALIGRNLEIGRFGVGPVSADQHPEWNRLFGSAQQGTLRDCRGDSLAFYLPPTKESLDGQVVLIRLTGHHYAFPLNFTPEDIKVCGYTVFLFNRKEDGKLAIQLFDCRDGKPLLKQLLEFNALFAPSCLDKDRDKGIYRPDHAYCQWNHLPYCIASEHVLICEGNRVLSVDICGQITVLHNEQEDQLVGLRILSNDHSAVTIPQRKSAFGDEKTVIFKNNQVICQIFNCRQNYRQPFLRNIDQPFGFFGRNQSILWTCLAKLKPESSAAIYAALYPDEVGSPLQDAVKGMDSINIRNIPDWHTQGTAYMDGEKCSYRVGNLGQQLGVLSYQESGVEFYLYSSDETGEKSSIYRADSNDFRYIEVGPTSRSVPDLVHYCEKIVSICKLGKKIVFLSSEGDISSASPDVSATQNARVLFVNRIKLPIKQVIAAQAVGNHALLMCDSDQSVSYIDYDVTTRDFLLSLANLLQYAPLKIADVIVLLEKNPLSNEIKAELDLYIACASYDEFSSKHLIETEKQRATLRQQLEGLTQGTDEYEKIRSRLQEADQLVNAVKVAMRKFEIALPIREIEKLLQEKARLQEEGNASVEVLQNIESTIKQLREKVAKFGFPRSFIEQIEGAYIDNPTAMMIARAIRACVHSLASADIIAAPDRALLK